MQYDPGMKRPRMEAGGAGFGMHGGGMGGAYGGMGGMGGPGMMEGPGQYMGGPDQYMGAGMGAGMGGAFPCVKLRGLPFDVSDEDIRMFLGLEAIDTILLKRDGRLTGEAFVVLAGNMQVEMALQKNRSYMGRRYIEIYRSKKADYYRAVVSEVNETGGTFVPREGGGGRPFQREEGPRYHGGGHAGGDAGYAAGGGDGYHRAGALGGGGGGDGNTSGTTILKLRGLPFSVSDDDICQWFNEDTSLGLSPVVKDNVLVVMDHGRPSGIAFVEFPTPAEATQAMGKNKQMLGTRYIEIFPANRADLERCR